MPRANRQSWVQLHYDKMAAAWRRANEMSSRDFLHKDAQTPHSEHYVMAGVLGSISTNSREILMAARESFCPVKGSHPQPQMSWRFWVDPNGNSGAPWPKPTFRGLDHLIFVGLDPQNSILIDLNRQMAIGRLSPALAADQQRWKTILFPNLLSLVGPAIGVTGLHCACVVREGKGMLLAGPSGSGKSTLTMALGLRGFSFLADDWTYFTRSDGGISAWGLIPRLKLLPPAAAYFPELAQFTIARSANGEEAFEIDPNKNLGIARSRSCEPQHLIFLERTSTPEFTLTRMSAADATAHLEEGLLGDTPEGLKSQLDIVQRLVDCGPWQLRYGEAPDTVAKKLETFFA